MVLRNVLVFAAALGVLLGAPIAVAGIPQPLSDGSLARLAAGAPTIVVGRCVAAQSGWDPSGRVIQTTATYEVERWLKGARPVPQVQVRLLGGTVGEISQVAVGGPVARTGERVVLFLTPAPTPGNDAFALVGWNLGKLAVVRGGTGADVIVASGAADPLPVRTPGRAQPAPDPGPASEVAIPVQVLERIVRGTRGAGR